MGTKYQPAGLSGGFAEGLARSVSVSVTVLHSPLIPTGEFLTPLCPYSEAVLLCHILGESEDWLQEYCSCLLQDLETPFSLAGASLHFRPTKGIVGPDGNSSGRGLLD